MKSVGGFEMENSGFWVEKPYWMTLASCCCWLNEEFMVRCGFKSLSCITLSDINNQSHTPTLPDTLVCPVFEPSDTLFRFHNPSY